MPCNKSMSSPTLRLYAQEYFNSLNSIAERIGADVSSTVAAYEDLWHTLSAEDQNQVLDDTIIHPEAVLKYSLYQPNDIGIECFPRLRLETGYKYVTDDDGGKDQGLKWRDEHSAPFTWMTRSQLNLSVIDNAEQNLRKTSFPCANSHGISSNKNFISSDGFVDPPDIVLGGSTSQISSSPSPKLNLAQKNVNGEDSLFTKLKSKTAVLKIQTTLKSTIVKSGPETTHCKLDNDKQTFVHSKISRSAANSLKILKPVSSKPPISKPKTPPPPPPTKPRVSAEAKFETDPERKALLSEVPFCGQVPKEMRKDHSVVRTTNSSESIDLGEFHINLNSPSKDVPKTGFDFLDNW